jgi:hypothetical protein
MSYNSSEGLPRRKDIMPAPSAASPARFTRRIRLPWQVGTLLAVFAALCLSVAACGGGSPTDGASSPSAAAGQGAGPGPSAQAAELAYAQCMRSHGDPGFPDPSTQGGFAGASQGASNAIDTTSPQYIAANKVCAHLRPAGPSQAQNQQRTEESLKYAACMRSHGISDFPDSMQITGQGDLNPSNPKFQSASQACKSLLPGRA